jgi:hypothetical protein
MHSIEASLILKLDGGRKIWTTNAPGVTSYGTNKDGSPAIASYSEGSFALSDDKGSVIVGPIQIEGALDLARAILEGNSRALTEPQAIVILATAVMGLVAVWPPEGPDCDNGPLLARVS